MIFRTFRMLDRRWKEGQYKASSQGDREVLQPCESEFEQDYGQRRLRLEGPLVYLLSHFYISHRCAARLLHLQGDTIYLHQIALFSFFLEQNKPADF